MSSWFRRDWSGFLWWETRSRRLFFPPRFCNYGRFDRNLQQDFYNIWKVYYLFLSLAELSLSTCHMVGWMNHKACATNNSACLLRSFQSEATTCVHVQAAWCIKVKLPSHYGFPCLCPWKCWPAGVGTARVLAFALTGASWIGPGFFKGTASPIWFGSTQQGSRFHPHATPAFPLLTDCPSFCFPLLIAAPTESCPCSRGSPRITRPVTYLSCSRPAAVPDTLNPPTGFNYWYYVSGLKGSAGG